MKLFTNRNLAVIIGLLCCVLSKAQTMDDFIWDFEWLEPDNRIEIVVGEPHQLRYNSRTNKSLAFTKEYAESWVHYDFSPMQHVVESPTGYSIDKNGVVTGLVAGRYAIKYTGLIQAKSGTDKWLYITVVNERTEKESNNTFDTANEITSKIRFGLYNSSDVDYFKYSNPGLKWGDIVTFKIHYTGYREAPFAYRYSTFSGTELSGSGALALQDQECRSLVFSGTTVYLEVYYDQSRTQYFQYGEEFVAEVLINGIPANEYGKEEDNGFEGEGTVEEPFMLKTAKDLENLSSLVGKGDSFSDSYFEMVNDIDLIGIDFIPIGNDKAPFAGHFDGKGFSITGLSIKGSTYVGLFGYTDGATINNVQLTSISLNGSQYTGGIAGYCKNTVITNCCTRGSIFSDDCTGALVGFSGTGTIIQNCYSSAQHTKYTIYGSVGGLVGYNCGIIENCYFYGTINAKNFDKSSTGGIVGYNHTTGAIHYCYFIKQGDVMNGEFNYCGSLNWGDCYVTETFNLYGITSSGKYIYDALNKWVNDHCSENRFRKWTSESFPTFDEYAEPKEEPETREYVDLGLPSGLLWATTNVGAKKAEECGSFFAWGETSSKASYSWDTYKYANGSETSLSKYCSSYTYGNVDYKEVLDKEDDAATVNWGETWRTPTLAESQELINYCTWAYTTLNGANGYKVTGPNGNYIFLPSTGVKEYDNTFFRTDVCMLTSTIFNAPNGKPSSASILYCENGSPHYWYGWSRCWGYTVRPVTGFNSSGISTPTTNTTDEIVAIYDANGHKLSSAQKGINIIKYKNGTSKKIVK